MGLVSEPILPGQCGAALKPGQGGSHCILPKGHDGHRDEPATVSAELDEMAARGVRVKLVAYAKALQQALEEGVPSQVLVENGIPAEDVVKARAGLGELPAGTSGHLGAGVFVCDEHDRRVCVLNGCLLHFAGDPSWCEPEQERLDAAREAQSDRYWYGPGSA